MFEKYEELREEMKTKNPKYSRFNVVSFLIGCNKKLTENDWDNIIKLWKENVIEE